MDLNFNVLMMRCSQQERDMLQIFSSAGFYVTTLIDKISVGGKIDEHHN